MAHDRANSRPTATHCPSQRQPHPHLSAFRYSAALYTSDLPVGYGAAKTDTSLGFIPLDGPHWSERRQWVKNFIEARVAALNGRDSLPVFGTLSDPSERVRRHLIERRIGELARWASGERKAEPYWLRKTCIHHRYVRLLRVAPAQHAREIYRVLRQCGHVRIDTALECYLADPALHTHRHLRADTLVPLRTLADVTGVAPGTIQQRMQRATAESVRDLGPQRRMAIGLDCLKVPFARQTRAAVAPPPPCPLFAKLLDSQTLSSWYATLSPGVRNVSLLSAEALANLERKRSMRDADCLAPSPDGHWAKR